MTTQVASAWSDVEFEPFPDGVATDDNIIVFIVSGATAASLVLALAVQVLATGRTRLPLLLLLMSILAAMVAAVCTWIVTYLPARDAIEKHAQHLLVFAGLTVGQRTTGDLADGVLLVQLLHRDVTRGLIDITAGYPAVHAELLALEQSVGRRSGTVHAVYLGTERGRIAGVERINVGSGVDTRVSETEVRLLVGVSPKQCEGASRAGYGTPDSPCQTDDIELRCDSNSDVWGTCRHRGCDAGDGSCAFCLTYRGTPRDDPDRCPGCSRCSAYMPPAQDTFVVSRNTSEWDLPDTAGLVSGLCYVEGAPELEGAPDVLFLQGYYPNGTAGRRWGGSHRLASIGGSSCSGPYDPRIRPWYARRDGVVWSPAYEFAVTGAVVEMGITVTRAVRNPGYSGAAYHSGVPPNLADDPWLGVLAIDFSFTSISRFLPSLLPTSGSTILIADLEGRLLAGSLPLDDMSVESTDAQGLTVYRPINVSDPGGWQRRDLHHVYLSIIRKFGSLQGAMRVRTVLQGGGAAVLSQPLFVEGGLEWVLAVRTPYSDLIEDSESATTLALVLAVIISVATALLQSVIVYRMLIPLHQLAQQMSDVACMQLDGLPQLNGGITAEVIQMVADFAVMVDSLKEYRSYLPRALLLVHDDNDSDADTAADGASRPSHGRVSDPTGQGIAVDLHQDVGSRPSSASTRATGKRASHASRQQPGELLQSSVSGTRVITLLACNTRNTHHCCKLAQLALRARLGSLVDSLSVVTTAAKGNVDGIVGDRARCSWNAVRNNASHRGRGAMAAARLLFPSVDSAGPLTLAVCSGEATCGNFGSAAFRYFAIVGSVCSFAHAVERYAAGCAPAGEALGLCEAGVRREQPEVYFRWQGAVIYDKHGSDPVTLWAFVGITEDQEPQEWMYAMADAEHAAPYADYNAAARAAASGDRARAIEVLKAVPQDSPQQPRAAALLQQLEAVDQGAPCPTAPLYLSDVGCSRTAPAAARADVAEAPPLSPALDAGAAKADSLRVDDVDSVEDAPPSQSDCCNPLSSRQGH